MRKKYLIADNGLKCHWNSFIVPRGFIAMTLFGHIFFRKEEWFVKYYITTNDGKITLNHERIHTLQAESFKTKYLAFYCLYIWYWFVNLFKYGVKKKKAYKMIPFEREAFGYEKNFNYNETNWKKFK